MDRARRAGFRLELAATHIASIEAGIPILVLAGMHSGCLELIANDSVRSIADLRGKKVGVCDTSSSPHVLVSLMAAYIGLDPCRNIEWVTSDDATSMQLFVDGRSTPSSGVPPEPQELRDRQIGHTILATAVDEPWSQYYCCMLAVSTEYVSKYPVATKRVLRALLKAVDLCVSEPGRLRGERSMAVSPAAMTTGTRWFGCWNPGESKAATLDHRSRAPL